VQWAVRTHKNQIWSVADDGVIHASANDKGDGRSWFKIDFLGDKIAFKASNGKYVMTKKNGALTASAPDANGESVYVWELINRGNLILRGEQGFLGTLPSGVVECNKSVPEMFQLHIAAGIVHISGSNGKYWKVNGDNITVNGTEPTPFTLEFSDLSKTLIKFGDKYLQGYQNGGFVGCCARSTT
jgi:fascin 1/2